jgi:hypothetical protein
MDGRGERQSEITHGQKIRFLTSLRAAVSKKVAIDDKKSLFSLFD